MNQTAGATNAYRRCSKGGKVRERSCVLGLERCWCALRRSSALGGSAAPTSDDWGGAGDALSSVTARLCASESVC